MILQHRHWVLWLNRETGSLADDLGSGGQVFTKYRLRRCSPKEKRDSLGPARRG